MSISKYSIYAPSLVRISLSLLFLWFGINQIFYAENFFGYVPDYLINYWVTIVFWNGIFETIAGGLLLMGYFTRSVSLVLGVHLFFITLSLGYNDIAVRDFCFMLITFSVALGGADKWCLDKRFL